MVRPGIQKHLEIAHLLACPVCGAAMHARDASAACANGHDFAVSSKGFLNLVPHQKPLRGYDEAFFTSRQRIVALGCYDAVREGVVQTLDGLGAAPVVVDAGCGEGSYAKAVAAEHARATVIGLDIAKDAIRVAARGGGPVRWLIADLANIPLADGCADVVLNVFTPANYGQFQRVLAPKGLLVKVIPAPLHMRELRELAGGQLSEAGFVDHGVAEHLGRRMRIVSRERVTQTSDVPAEAVEDLVRMSPVAFGARTEALDLDRLTRITVDAEIVCARA